MSEKRDIKICFYMTGSYQVFARKALGYGGAEINLYYLAREFAQNPGYKVEFLVGDYGQRSVEVIENVKLRRIKYLNPSRFHRPWHLLLRRWYFIKEVLTNRSDLFFVSTAGEFLGYLVFIVRYLKGKKTLFRVGHDWDIDGTIAERRNHIGWLYKYALTRFDQIVTQNRRQSELLMRRYGLSSEMIKNGFPIGDIKKKTPIISCGWAVQ